MGAFRVMGRIGRSFLALVGAGFVAVLCRSIVAPREPLDPDGEYFRSAYDAPFSYVAEFGGEAAFVFLGVMLFLSLARIRSRITVNLLLGGAIVYSILVLAAGLSRRDGEIVATGLGAGAGAALLWASGALLGLGPDDDEQNGSAVDSYPTS